MTIHISITILWIAACCAAISFTITTTSIFEWLREGIAKLHHKAEELIFCPWCFNHYVVAVFLLTSGYYPVEVSGFTAYNFLFNLFAIVGVSGMIHYVLLRAYEPVMKNMMNREKERAQRKRNEDFLEGLKQNGITKTETNEKSN